MTIRAAILSVFLASVAVSAYAAPPVTVTGPDGKQAAVKAASTAAAATDPSVVVQLSPNGGQSTAANQTTGNGYLASIAAAAAGTGPTTTGNLAATLSMSTATTTKIITGVSAKSTYVTGYNITVDAATLVSVVYGTGTNCGTGTTTIAQHTFPANGGITIGVGMANILPAVAASTDVCITVSSSANTKINASYVQQ